VATGNEKFWARTNKGTTGNRDKEWSNIKKQ